MRFMKLRQANTNIMCICARREYTFYFAEDGAVLCISITHELTEHPYVLLAHSEGRFKTESSSMSYFCWTNYRLKS